MAQGRSDCIGLPERPTAIRTATAWRRRRISSVVKNLPQAIQLVLPMLASDGGRARVRTLLAIQGAGPDYVWQHLTDIAGALGVSSPGTATLADLRGTAARLAGISTAASPLGMSICARASWSATLARSRCPGPCGTP
jgi:hypothetical protein